MLNREHTDIATETSYKSVQILSNNLLMSEYSIGLLLLLLLINIKSCNKICQDIKLTILNRVIRG